jgi:hypothetical protein
LILNGFFPDWQPQMAAPVSVESSDGRLGTQDCKESRMPNIHPRPSHPLTGGPSLITLAHYAGANFWPTDMFSWRVTNMHGATIVEHAPSMDGAARLYVEATKPNQPRPDQKPGQVILKG